MTDATQALPPIEERPLVTFALFAYNQEKYIREAVEGAFSQTYEPLEIILSDDCSTDRTFEIMQNMAHDYLGPHKLSLNKNPRNLGIGGHINKIDAMAKGELILHAAGDDISLPQRAAIIASAWLSSGHPGAIWSNASLIDENGKSLEKLHINESRRSQTLIGENNPRDALGATIGVSRKLIEKFGFFDSSIFTEDVVISYRALISDGIRYIDPPLVLYRKHESISKAGTDNKEIFLDFHRRWALCGIQMVRQNNIDRAKVGLQRKSAVNSLVTLWFNEGRLEIASGSLLLSLIKITRLLFFNMTAAKHLIWLLLVRLGIKKNFHT